MCAVRRRMLMSAVAGWAAALVLRAQAAPEEAHRRFVEAAFAMKRQAVESGDQAYGAVVVRSVEIVGWGPSRVVTKGDPTAHAEREAIRDAQRRLGRSELADCVMYSSSRPCSECEKAAAGARLARLYAGAGGRDFGVPRSGG